MLPVIRISVALFTLGLLLGAGPSDNEGTASVQVVQNDTLGTYLADAEGQSLYLFLDDEASDGADVQSTCNNECAANWPPLVVDGEPVAGEGVASSLLGTTERQDGSTQVTYNGWPLYYYESDEEANATTGHGVGDVWFLVSPYGEPVAAQSADTEAEAQTEEADQEAAQEVPDSMLTTALKGEGQEVYTNVATPACAGCHGQSGEGGAGPTLAGSSRLDDSSFVIRQILQGGAHMPPYKDQLSDRQIAAVATFVRTSWENTFGAVTEEEVAEAR